MSSILYSHLQLSKVCETVAPKWVSRQLGFCTLPQSFCTDVNYWIQCESWHTECSGLKSTSLHWEGSCSSLTGLQSSDLKMLNPQTPIQQKSLSAYLTLQTPACKYFHCLQHCVGREGKAPESGKLSPTSLNKSNVQPNILCFKHKTGSHLNNNINQASIKFCINQTKIKSR